MAPSPSRPPALGALAVAGFCLAANAGFVNTATVTVWGRSVSSVTGATATLGAGAATGQADDVLQSAVSA
jgi:uncharacterized membrane protein YoaK (UPF0700 family)